MIVLARWAFLIPFYFYYCCMITIVNFHIIEKAHDHRCVCALSVWHVGVTCMWCFLSHGYHMYVTWTIHVYFTWTSYGFMYCTPCVCHMYRARSRCMPHDEHHMGSAWVSHGHHMCVTWTSHVCHMDIYLTQIHYNDVKMCIVSCDCELSHSFVTLTFKHNTSPNVYYI